MNFRSFRFIKFFWFIFYSFFLYSDSWRLPDSSRKYHEVTFLTSHNSFSSEEDGYIQPQQKWCIEKQLENGIRGFMLDTHYSSKLMTRKKKVCLCHNNYLLTRIALRPFKGKPMSFKKSLEIFKKFLEQNSKEIITIFLENYTEGNDIDQIIESSNISNLVLKLSDWNPIKNNGWPTLKWMQEKNKRLVIFNQRGQTKYTFDEWVFHAENQFGTISFSKVLNERYESKLAGKENDRYLYVMNYFPQFYIKSLQRIDFNKINSQYLKIAIEKHLQDGCYKNRYPNFIALDFVDIGDGLKHVNCMNNITKNVTKRKIMYAMLPKKLVPEVVSETS